MTDINHISRSIAAYALAAPSSCIHRGKSKRHIIIKHTVFYSLCVPLPLSFCPFSLFLSCSRGTHTHTRQLSAARECRSVSGWPTWNGEEKWQRRRWWRHSNGWEWKIRRSKCMKWKMWKKQKKKKVKQKSENIARYFFLFIYFFFFFVGRYFFERIIFIFSLVV